MTVPPVANAGRALRRGPEVRVPLRRRPHDAERRERVRSSASLDTVAGARRLTSFSAVSTAGWLTSTGADYLE